MSAHNLRFSLRQLAKAPVQAAAVVISIGLGIGINTALFSFVNFLLLQPLPAVKDPGSLVSIYGQNRGTPLNLPVSYLNCLEIRRQNALFNQIAFYQQTRVGLAGYGGEAQEVRAEMVSADLMPMFRVDMTLGRGFLPEEDLPTSASQVVILSHRIWQRRYGGDQSVVGRKILLNGRPFMVVGVAAPGFGGTSAVFAAELWVPISAYRYVYPFPDRFLSRGEQALQVIGRLKPDVLPSAVTAELTTIAARLEREFPDENKGLVLASVSMAGAGISPGQRPVFLHAAFFFMAIAGFILLLACGNVANLLLARTASRGRELAMRLALGADRRRLAWLLLTENFVLLVPSCLVALVVARWTRDLLWQQRPPFLTTEAPFIVDRRVIFLAILLTLLAGIVLSGASVIAAGASNCATLLKQGEPLLHKSRLSLAKLSLFIQAALSTVCLACAGFFLVGLHNAYLSDPGFERKDLLAITFNLRHHGYTESQGRALYRQILERMEGMPGVRSASIGENRLLGGFGLWRSVAPVGGAGKNERVMAGSGIVDAAYFRTVGIPIVRGRSFTSYDRAGAAPVAIVNQTLAKQLWASHEPVGGRIALDQEGGSVEVVGVARDAKYLSLGESPRPFLYMPIGERYTSRATLHVRLTPGPRQAVSRTLLTVKDAIRAIDPTLPLIEAVPIPDVLDQSLWFARLAVAALGLLALLALTLATIGMYGITAHSIQRSRLEVGIRLAVGARRESIVLLFIRRDLTFMALGILFGLGIAWLLGRSVSTLVYRGPTADAIVLFPVAAFLLAVGLATILIPAIRIVHEAPANRLTT